MVHAAAWNALSCKPQCHPLPALHRALPTVCDADPLIVAFCCSLRALPRAVLYTRPRASTYA
jgi:hypothetical protein